MVVSADFNQSQVYSNMGDGTFANITDYSIIIDENGMGAALGDYDNDGDQDWFVGSILATTNQNFSALGNRLYKNNQGIFEDVTEAAGVANGGWAWGSCFADFNNDGYLDIYHTNGYSVSAEVGPDEFSNDESRLFIANGDGTFSEQAESFGLNDQEEGRGIVCADFDGDGQIDILQMTLNETNAISLYRNENENSGNFIKVTLHGTSPNSQAIGARIIVNSAGRDQYRDVMLGSNFASHNPTQQHVGIGDSQTIEFVTVKWPDGQQSVFSDVEVNQLLEIPHPNL